MPIFCNDYVISCWIEVVFNFNFPFLGVVIHVLYLCPCWSYHFGIGIFVQVHPISDGNSADASELDDPGTESGQSSSKYSNRQRYYFLSLVIYFINF